MLPDWDRALLLCLLYSRSVQVSGGCLYSVERPSAFSRVSISLFVCVCVCVDVGVLSLTGLPVVTVLI